MSQTTMVVMYHAIFHIVHYFYLSGNTIYESVYFTISHVFPIAHHCPVGTDPGHGRCIAS